MSIDRKELGSNGFMINPIERGQTFIARGAGGIDRTLTVLGIMGTDVLMKEHDTKEVVTEDLLNISRRGHIDNRPIVEVFPPVNERLIDINAE
ncbi:MAG: hypothetical protein ACD_30C00081G0008 [uncultured bacterium]|uniref:Uncharacterized protein n=3 Tax=Candidatus Daviesiibacteriota TaxID=1752718 RepID=A0A0G0I303_9BACT|nr:MAG: hypothetical protein ACD_30C00081G0008 [uncultured bacterium]KKQ10491.1 MAG: hypothetical protein US19_C0004G0039 [Candidatus Daviesbacteria bacterium GW2011_GWB1_36_5]KKQ15672.1 MAG: hypothetical protein US28_C0012G0009 [Candidatus Daviesbacteria bacterium GW2011_GWA1_36_8]OGE32604.1 MAG: hypothetical protein A3C99_01920 [Candidatus Daviesbacteria bacterium RIFCSPHIGHO2_02_FULL_37_9]OGE36197.1 MAG: hypothetical protein A3E66_05315 [Candidatus Daviesbacteria bacterium RIFCSPHIGHO2_12_FU